MSPRWLRLLIAASLLATAVVVWAATQSPNGPTKAQLAAAVSRRPIVVHVPAAVRTTATVDVTSTVTAPAGSVTVTDTVTSSVASSSAAATSSHASTAAPTKTTSAAAKTAKSPIQHVFVIVLSSPGYAQTWGSGSAATYLNGQLRPKGTLLSGYSAVSADDLPNYIAMVSAQPPNPDTEQDCPVFATFPQSAPVSKSGVVQGSGCVYPETVLTLPDQVTSSGHVWHGYIEDLASGSPPVTSCRHPNTGQPDNAVTPVTGDQYLTRHNPFVYFGSLLDLGDCASDDVDLGALSSDLASASKTPELSYIVPNACDDGTDAPCVDGAAGGLEAEDAFLQTWVPKILAAPAYRTGLVVITFATPAAGAASDQVGALLLSPYVAAGKTEATGYNHYSLVRSIEDLFGLTHLAEASSASVPSFASLVSSKPQP